MEDEVSGKSWLLWALWNRVSALSASCSFFSIFLCLHRISDSRYSQGECFQHIRGIWKHHSPLFFLKPGLINPLGAFETPALTDLACTYRERDADNSTPSCQLIGRCSHRPGEENSPLNPAGGRWIPWGEFPKQGEFVSYSHLLHSLCRNRPQHPAFGVQTSAS